MEVIMKFSFTHVLYIVVILLIFISGNIISSEFGSIPSIEDRKAQYYLDGVEYMNSLND